MNSERFYKALVLAQILDTLLPVVDHIPRIAITTKTNAEDINLNRSKSSQQARKIEDKLAADLEALFNKIMADPLAQQKDQAVLEKKYGPTVEQTIRTAVQQIYLIGSDYATKTQNTTAFITQTDLQNIQKQVSATYAAFWRRVYNALHKDDIIIPTEPETKPVDPAVEAALISTVTATTTLALSTLSKLKQLGGDTPKTMVWVTEQDSKVCEICRPLSGQEWEENDPTMKMPGPDTEGGDTHHRCRCRLMVKDGDDILVG